MTVQQFSTRIGLDVICIPEPEREIGGVYIGDLLSWVMGRAEEGDVWITIMSNINTVAVASLADVATILLTANVKPDEDALAAAKTKGINILSTPLSSYEAAVKIHEVLS